mmetsp:Transcript_957/g.1058  ORF Transcript_957/g.1058 Transcript_957/m.1058 type:complete len:306 (+) Transcript_957:129-1046(+)
MSAFSQRPGWEDVVPVPQDDGPNPVVTIAYTHLFRQLMDLFRAVLRSGELSERVLELTEEILDQNAANYTVWQYRRECLRHLHSDLDEELYFMDSFAEENPKNYQIWYHRRAIVEELGEATRELEFCAKVFREDAKNYHAWAHRQWVLLRFSLWKGELEFIEKLLIADIRNNSAWNQRWFVVHNGPDPVTSQILEREVLYTFKSIDTCINNESSWNYLRGLSKYHPELVNQIKAKCLQFDINDSDILKNKESPFALSLLADLREVEGSLESYKHAEKLYSRLCDIDRIRIKYWTRKAQKAALMSR